MQIHRNHLDAHQEDQVMAPPRMFRLRFPTIILQGLIRQFLLEDKIRPGQRTDRQ